MPNSSESYGVQLARSQGLHPSQHVRDEGILVQPRVAEPAREEAVREDAHEGDEAQRTPLIPDAHEPAEEADAHERDLSHADEEEDLGDDHDEHASSEAPKRTILGVLTGNALVRAIASRTQGLVRSRQATERPDDVSPREPIERDETPPWEGEGAGRELSEDERALRDRLQNWRRERPMHHIGERKARRLIAEGVMTDITTPLGEDVAKEQVLAFIRVQKAVRNALDTSDQISYAKDQITHRLRQEDGALIAEEVRGDTVISQAKLFPDGRTELTLNYADLEGEGVKQRNPGIIDSSDYPRGAIKTFELLSADILRSSRPNEQATPSPTVVPPVASEPRDDAHDLARAVVEAPVVLAVEGEAKVLEGLTPDERQRVTERLPKDLEQVALVRENVKRVLDEVKIHRERKLVGRRKFSDASLRKIIELQEMIESSPRWREVNRDLLQVAPYVAEVKHLKPEDLSDLAKVATKMHLSELRNPDTQAEALQKILRALPVLQVSATQFSSMIDAMQSVPGGLPQISDRSIQDAIVSLGEYKLRVHSGKQAGLLTSEAILLAKLCVDAAVQADDPTRAEHALQALKASNWRPTVLGLNRVIIGLQAAGVSDENIQKALQSEQIPVDVSGGIKELWVRLAHNLPEKVRERAKKLIDSVKLPASDLDKLNGEQKMRLLLSVLRINSKLPELLPDAFPATLPEVGEALAGALDVAGPEIAAILATLAL